MDGLILITILTACGVPQSAFFIDMTDQTVVGITIEEEDLMIVTKSRLLSNPGLELDVAKELGLHCA